MTSGQSTRSASLESRVADVHADLAALLHGADSMAARGSLSDERIGEIISYVAEIRKLLQELTSVLSLHGQGTARTSLADLQARFLDLEGKIKEIRNDAEMKGGGHASQQKPRPD